MHRCDCYILPFKKYRGQRICTVPWGYVAWLYEEVLPTFGYEARVAITSDLERRCLDYLDSTGPQTTDPDTARKLREEVLEEWIKQDNYEELEPGIKLALDVLQRQYDFHN